MTMQYVYLKTNYLDANVVEMDEGLRLAFSGKRRAILDSQGLTNELQSAQVLEHLINRDQRISESNHALIEDIFLDRDSGTYICRSSELEDYRLSPDEVKTLMVGA